MIFLKKSGLFIVDRNGNVVPLHRQIKKKNCNP